MHNLLSFELRLQARQLAFGIFIIGYFAFSILLGARIFGGENEVVNSDYSLAFHLGLLSLSLVFPIMFFTVRASLRDQQFHFSEIIFSTSLSRWQYFSSRYLGVLLMATAVAIVSVIGFALGISLSDVTPNRKLAFSLMPYLRIFWYLLFPNVAIFSLLIFSLSCWTKSSTATYLGSTLLYAAYWLCAIFLNSPLLAQSVSASPENMVLAAMLDPFGLSAFFEQTQFWTIPEKNQNLLSIKGLLGWNRLGWLGTSVLIMRWVYATFSWRSLENKTSIPLASWIQNIKPGKSGRLKRPEGASEITNPNLSRSGIHWVKPNTKLFLFHWSVFVSLLRQHLRFLFSNLPFLLSALVLMGIFGIEMYSYVRGGGEYQQNLLPTTSILIERIVDPLMIFTLLLLLFYTSELMWRDKDYRIASIVDASPIGLGSQYFACFMGLAMIPFVLLSQAILCGLSFQLLLGYDQLHWDFWLGTYYYQGIQLLLYLALTMGVHLLVPNKYMGLLLSVLLILLLSSSLSHLLGIHHPMLRLVRLPSVIPTDMTAYGYAAFSFHHYAIYWAALLAIFTLLAIPFWKYPRPTIALRAVSFCSLLFLLVGAKIFYFNNIEIDYYTPNELLDQREDYEKRFKQYETLAHLSYHSLSSKVDIYPDDRSLTVEAHYVLINQQQKPIQQLFLSAREAVDTISLEGAELVLFNAEHQTYLYRFPQPIAPGQKVNFHYKSSIQYGIFSDNKSLATNGTFLLNKSYEPVLFYRSSLEINDPQERVTRGLPPKLAEKPEEQLHQHTTGLSRVNFAVTLSVPADQYALAPGQLLSHWKTADRSFYQYQSQQPIVPLIAFIAGKYQVVKQQYQDIQIEQYYHPAHHHNIDSIQRYVAATLDYCIANFGPYPYDYLRIAEIPAHWGFGGQAQAGLIAMVADKLYLTDIRDPTAFNLIAKRTIHEVAHQWWGHLLAPKNIAGAALIIEGLAKYTEAMVMQQLFGVNSKNQIAAEAQQRYMEGRAFDQQPEPPLYLQDGQDYLAYGKSCLALLAVEDLIGEQQMNAALRQLIQQFGQQMNPEMTSLDLIDALACYVPEEEHYLLDKWFMENTTPPLPVKSWPATPD